MGTMTPQITVVGSINADITVTVERHPAPGETLLGAGGGITPGGKGANQAVAAARLGASVAFVGAVGTDTNAAPATALLRAGGVDLTHVEAVQAAGGVPGVTGLALITVDDKGENTIIVVPGANEEVDQGFVDKHAAPVEAAELVLLQGEIPASGIARAAQLARGRVVLNLAPVVDVPREVLLAADPLIANEHEAGLILRQLGEAGDGSPRECAQRLIRAGIRTVVITLGAEGALVADADGVREIATPRVKAVDTVGAGDAFVGALCSRLVAGERVDDAAVFAARVGAYSVTRAGAQPSYPGLGDALPGT